MCAGTIAYEDFIKYKGEQGAKEAGRMRLEGKEYVVKDGDVLHFRLNVWGQATGGAGRPAYIDPHRSRVSRGRHRRCRGPAGGRMYARRFP